MATKTRNNDFNENARTDQFGFDSTSLPQFCCDGDTCDAYFTVTKDAAGDLTFDYSTISLPAGESKARVRVEIYDSKGNVLPVEMDESMTSEEVLATALHGPLEPLDNAYSIWLVVLTDAGTECKSFLCLNYADAVVATAYYSQGHTA